MRREFKADSLFDSTTPTAVAELEQIVFSHLLIAEELPLQALAVLEKLILPAKGLRRFRNLIEIYALHTLAHHLLGKREGALTSFSEALSLATPQGFVRVFVDLGKPIEDFLRQPATRQLNQSYVQTLLSAFAIPEELAVQDTPEIDPPLEQISSREMEVLRLLNTHLNSTEIAGELSISVNTARFHIKNIYAKLGAHSRSEAIALAIEQSIL